MVSASGKSKTLAVEIAYATPARQLVLPIRIRRGTTVEQAVRACGILKAFPEIDPARTAVGIFGQRVAWNQPLANGDRVEIYRSLIADPQQARRRRAARRRRPRSA